MGEKVSASLSPSLRAKRGNPGATRKELDCFVASAPRNDGERFPPASPRRCEQQLEHALLRGVGERQRGHPLSFRHAWTLPGHIRYGYMSLTISVTDISSVRVSQSGLQRWRFGQEERMGRVS